SLPVRRTRAMLPVALFATVAHGCTRAPPPPLASAEAGVEDSTRAPLSIAAARRCGECHGALEQQWRQSAHARAESSAVYRAMARAARDDRCRDCHAPIESVAGPDSPVRGEGVTCDACHAMREARADPAGGVFSLNLVDNTKYGPVCDAKNHYFHKVGCSP